MHNEVPRVHINGGAPAHTAALQTMDLSTPEKNWEMYSNWADSIRSFPEVTKQKVRENMQKWVLVTVTVPTLHTDPEAILSDTTTL